MDLLKTYPWAKELKVSKKDFKSWQLEDTQASFVFWSLKNKVIDKKEYFNWAKDHYQIPLLEDLFFEQHLIKKVNGKKSKTCQNGIQKYCL